MILRLTVEVQNEAHQNEVLNRVEATGAQLLGAEGIVGGKNYHILPPQTIVPVTPLLDLVEYQKWVIGEAEPRTDLEKQIAAQFMPDQPEMVEHMPFLTYLAEYCANILEIGCGHGNGSTRAFERGLKSIENPSKVLHHVTIDVDEQRPHVRPVCTSHYSFESLVGDSRVHNTYDVLTREGMEFDLIYIDTEHTYEVLQAELLTIRCAGLIHDGVLLVFHDTWMFGEYNRMTDAIKEFAQSLGWTFNDYTKVSHGLGLLYKPVGGWQRFIEESTPKSHFYPNES